MKYFKKHKRLIIGGVLLVFLVWVMSAGLILLSARKDQKIFQKEIQECYEKLEKQVDQLKKQEKELKEQFARSSQLSEKTEIKAKLNSLQKTLFDQKHELRYHPYREKMPQKPTRKRDKKALASSIKEALKKQLAELENGINKEPEYSEWGGFQGDPIFQFYFLRFELDEKDCQEIRKIIRQISNIKEVIREQEELKKNEKMDNNPNLFNFSYEMSTERNGGWQSYKTFYGRHKGHELRVYVPDEHPALNNVLFNDGWGTNAEIENFFLLEGIEAPAELQYWNVEKQKMEIIPEQEVEQAVQEGKMLFYENFVDLKENITINYYRERERERERESKIGG